METISNSNSVGDKLGYKKDSKESMPWEHYLAEYGEKDPAEIARNLNIPYDPVNKTLTLEFLGTIYHISWPAFNVTHDADDRGYYPLEDMIYAKILTIRFLINGHESSGSGKMKTYREMPWGEVYLRQFDGRCIKRLAFSYGFKLDLFRKIMDHLHAQPVSFGDVGYKFDIYPGYSLQLMLWEGDDEFPPSSQILFSDNFPVSFSAEDMAVTGDVIIGSLKRYSQLV